MFMMSDSQDVTYREKLRTLKPFNRNTRKLKLGQLKTDLLKKFKFY